MPTQPSVTELVTEAKAWLDRNAPRRPVPATPQATAQVTAPATGEGAERGGQGAHTTASDAPSGSATASTDGREAFSVAVFHALSDDQERQLLDDLAGWNQKRPSGATTPSPGRRSTAGWA